MTSLCPDRILKRARDAQSGWAALGVRKRCALLGRLRREIARDCDSIAELIARETAKPFLDALSGDVLVSLEMIRYYEARAPKILRSHRVGRPSFFFRGASFETCFEPHGVALIFGPSNYPLQLSLVPAITALAAGNAVVLKCSERTPRTATLISDLCTRAGLPPDVVQVLHDGPEQAASLIDAGPDIIFFTGSTDHGRNVARRAAQQLIPTIMELGGKDAALVFADCHMERAVEGITYGAFANGGRVCVGVKRAYVEAFIYNDFVARLSKQIATLRVASDLNADLCPPAPEQASLLRAQVEDALAHGASLLYPPDIALLGNGPVVLDHVPPTARILAEECFGPVLCIAPFIGEDEALSLANSSDFALSASVWTHNRARGRRVARQVSAGSCGINDVIRVIANPHAPFGGNKLSGHGRYHGPEGLRAFSRTRTIMTSADRRAREINWFPFTTRIGRQLAALLRFRHGSIGLGALLNRMLPLLLGAILSLGVQAQSTSPSHLTIDVQLNREAHGELAYLIFNSPKGFPGDRDQAVRRGFLPIPPGARDLHINVDLPPGTYAATVYEDRNGNHKLDRNILGIPREPVGASNNPPSRMGPPNFRECSFTMGTAAQTITIRLVRGI